MICILLTDEECFGAAVVSSPGKLRCFPGVSRLLKDVRPGIGILFSFKGCSSCVYSRAIRFTGRRSRVYCDCSFYLFLMARILLADKDRFGTPVISCPDKLRRLPGMTRLRDLDGLGVCILFSSKGCSGGIYSRSVHLTGRRCSIYCDCSFYLFLMARILLTGKDRFGAAVISCPGKLRRFPGMSRLLDHRRLGVGVLFSFKGCSSCVYSRAIRFAGRRSRVLCDHSCLFRCMARVIFTDKTGLCAAVPCPVPRMDSPFMTGRRHRILRSQDLSADGAVASFCQSGFGTGRCHSRVCNCFMSPGQYYGCGGCFASTGHSGMQAACFSRAAILGAGCRRDSRLFLLVIHDPRKLRCGECASAR